MQVQTFTFFHLKHKAADVDPLTFYIVLSFQHVLYQNENRRAVNIQSASCFFLVGRLVIQYDRFFIVCLLLLFFSILVIHTLLCRSIFFFFFLPYPLQLVFETIKTTFIRYAAWIKHKMAKIHVSYQKDLCCGISFMFFYTHYRGCRHFDSYSLVFVLLRSFSVISR